MSDQDICSVCKQSREWHKEHHPRHAFQSEGGVIEAAAPESSGGPSSNPPAPRLPGDPILRALLIRKGLISAEELDAVEAELRATGLVVAHSVVNVYNTDNAAVKPDLGHAAPKTPVGMDGQKRRAKPRSVKA